jgi:hypothetical protein
MAYASNRGAAFGLRRGLHDWYSSMPRIPYTVSVSARAQGVSAEEFAAKVAAVLHDPRGWRKYGYRFYQVAAPCGSALHIHLEAADDADRLCRARGFSCWRPPSNDIVIHLGNWMGGSASRLPLDRYRNYVINHEVGHSLGLPHRKCPAAECARRGVTSCPASVMQQMTRGPGHVSPCIEADWPLDPDWGTDDPRPRAKVFPGISLLLVIFAVIIVLVACLVAAVRVAPAAGRGCRGAAK